MELVGEGVRGGQLKELPVGVLTALLGGGYLLWLMHRQGVVRGVRGAL